VRSVSNGMGFGAIFQLGYVVADIDAALDHWVRTGVGPWYVLDPLPIEHFSYRGGPSIVPEVTIALSYSGGMQVELIHQRDDAPTMYRDFLAATGGGLQHLGYLPAGYDASLAAAVAAGWEQAHVGHAAGTRFVYLDGGGHPGSVAELVDLDPTSRSFFGHIADEAAGWDGVSDPVRRVGQRRRRS